MATAASSSSVYEKRGPAGLEREPYLGHSRTYSPYEVEERGVEWAKFLDCCSPQRGQMDFAMAQRREENPGLDLEVEEADAAQDPTNPTYSKKAY
jgi:hypothetical protein